MAALAVLLKNRKNVFVKGDRAVGSSGCHSGQNCQPERERQARESAVDHESPLLPESVTGKRYRQVFPASHAGAVARRSAIFSLLILWACALVRKGGGLRHAELRRSAYLKFLAR
jgi:hypothetical protein